MKPFNLGVFILSIYLLYAASGGAETDRTGGGEGSEEEEGEEQWSWTGAVSHGGNISCGIGKTSPIVRRIVGSLQAKPEEFPWQVAFRWETETSRSPIHCSGSLIDKKWVVSAAHCFPDVKTVPRSQLLKAVLGEFNVWNNEGDEVVFDIKRVFRHPAFEYRGPGRFRNDIALVELNGEVSYNDYMKPVCLPEGNTIFSPGEMCTVTGFGRVSEDGYPSVTLRKTSVPIVDNPTFSQIYGPWALFAGHARGEKGPCGQGDAGGPLACLKDGKFYLSGVTSSYIGCARAGFPGVYANVKFFMDWIEQTKKTNANWY